MYSIIRAFILLSIATLLVAPVYSQSLGDVARQKKQKQQASGTQHKVITDDDLPHHSESESTSSSDASAENKRSEPSTHSSAEDKGQRGEQLKSAIRAQKNAVASLQNQIEKMNASVHFVEANRYSNGVEYNQHQARKQEEVQRMQSQLEEQKKKLEEMQESARRDGFGSSVYDP
jgi:predicted RNase H-like nuclease (RuvC/YqgF family)